MVPNVVYHRPIVFVCAYLGDSKIRENLFLLKDLLKHFKRVHNRVVKFLIDEMAVLQFFYDIETDFVQVIRSRENVKQGDAVLRVEFDKCFRLGV